MFFFYVYVYVYAKMQTLCKQNESLNPTLHTVTHIFCILYFAFFLTSKNESKTCEKSSKLLKNFRNCGKL